MELIATLKTQGVSVILISHNLHDIFAIADRIVVLRRGEVRLAGSEVDQLGALGAQFGGFRGDGHRGRDFNASDAIGKDFAGSGCCRHDESIFSDFAAWRGEMRRVCLTIALCEP